jgi:hypothetical protein
LGCWIEDGKQTAKPPRPAPLPARDALEILAFESLLVAGTASSMGEGYQLTEHDKQRLLIACSRIQQIHGTFL